MHLRVFNAVSFCAVNRGTHPSRDIFTLKANSHETAPKKRMGSAASREIARKKSVFLNRSYLFAERNNEINKIEKLSPNFVCNAKSVEKF